MCQGQSLQRSARPSSELFDNLLHPYPKALIPASLPPHSRLLSIRQSPENNSIFPPNVRITSEVQCFSLPCLIPHNTKPERSKQGDTLEGRVPLSTGFVGRQQEMEGLKVALEDAISGRGRLVMLAGGGSAEAHCFG